MSEPSRRALLAGAAIVTATAALAQDQGGQPVESQKGAPILGPRNPAREGENPDLLRPPPTDHGTIPNLRFSFADAHVKMRDGGWSREVTVRELPIATTMAGVNMRLTSGGVRELHWHKQAEWSIMLAGGGTDHLRRHRRPQFYRRRDARRLVVFSTWDPAFDPGPAAGRV